jgi:hypothetical protein
MVGVNKFLLDEDEDVPVLKVDNAAVRKMQLDKLTPEVRTGRAEVAAKLDAIAEAAAGTEGNLLALAVDAARAKATVGEISEAIERSQGRHQAIIRRPSKASMAAASKAPRRPTRRSASPLPSRRNMAASRKSISPRWARTVTTVARKSSLRR